MSFPNVVSLYWYSQTGHSHACLKIAREVLEQEGASTTMMPMAHGSKENPRADLLGFTLPVFNFNVPVPVKHYLKTFPRLDIRSS